jgi:diketogulonate reductase-like aldo/keto reductase
LTHNYLSQLAYGTGTAWFKPANKRSSIDQTLVSSIKSAIKLGYHHLDGAEVYGTEPELGIAIKESKVPRERLFVTTKIIDSSIKDIPGALDASLKKLGLDYVDLYVALLSLQNFTNAEIATSSILRSGQSRLPTSKMRGLQWNL